MAQMTATGISCAGSTQRICPTNRSFRCSAPRGLKASKRISVLAPRTNTTSITASGTADRRRSVPATNREGEQYRRRVDPLGDELGAARVLVGGIDHAAHALCGPFGDKLRQVLAAWRNARLRFDGAGLTQAKPIFEITPALVVG